MKTVALSGLGREILWKGYDEVFDPGEVGVLQAHLDLAIHAVKLGWDENTLVVQDDVENVEIGDHCGEITAYTRSSTGQWGWIRYPDHVCPKAFTATERGWKELVESWSREGKTCELWTPDYVTVGGEGVLPGRYRHSMRARNP